MTRSNRRIVKSANTITDVHADKLKEKYTERRFFFILIIVIIFLKGWKGYFLLISLIQREKSVYCLKHFCSVSVTCKHCETSSTSRPKTSVTSSINQQYMTFCALKKNYTVVFYSIFTVYIVCLFFLYGWLLLLFEMFYFKSFIKVARFFVTNCFVYVESFSSVWSIRGVFFPKEGWRPGGCW